MNNYIFVTLFCLLSTILVVRGQTLFTDNDFPSDVILTKANSPYTFAPIYSLTVTFRANLRVEAGVRVIVADYVQFSIVGQLYTFGTAADRVVFTGNNWMGITAFKANLNQTTIENLPQGSIRITTPSTSSIYTDCIFRGLKQFSSGSDSWYTRVHFENIIDQMIMPSATILGCRFQNLTLVWISYRTAKDLIFENVERVRYNSDKPIDGALFRSGRRSMQLEFMNIINSQFLEGDYKLSSYVDGREVFKNNLIYNCSMTILITKQTTVENNVFYDVSSAGNSLLTVSEPTSSLTSNVFMNVTAPFILRTMKGTGTVIAAQNNYWNGAKNSTVVHQMSIYDSQDDVQYIPAFIDPIVTFATMPQIIESYYNRNLSAGDNMQCSGQNFCNNKGDCIGPGQCVCYSGYGGTDCSIQLCGWRTDYSLYAPEPVVVATYDTSNIQFEITMKNNLFRKVVQHISLQRITYSPGAPKLNITSNSAQQLSTSTCESRYRVTIPWSSLSIQRTMLQDQRLRMEAVVWVYYIYNETIATSSPSYIEFSTSKVFYSELKSTAFVMISTNVPKVAEMTLLRMLNSPGGAVQIDAQLYLPMNGTTLDSVTFVNSTTSVTFQISHSRIGTTPSYLLQMTSTNHTSSLIGRYIINASVQTDYGTVSNLISFDIFMDNIAPIPVSNVTVDTVITVRQSLNGSPQSSFTYGENPYVVTALKPSVPQLSSGQRLQLENAYICCPTTAYYDPTINSLGCSVYDSEAMNYWAQLVANGAPVPTLETQIHASSNNRSTVFSFNVNSLTDESRKCYVQVNTELKNVARRLSADAESPTTANFIPLYIEKRSVTSAAASLSVTGFLLVVIATVNLLFYTIIS